MIGEFFLNILFSFITGVFKLLPDFSWDPSSAGISFLGDCVASVCYLLPMDTVIAVVNIVIWFTLFKIVVSFLRTLWDILPIV